MKKTLITIGVITGAAFAGYVVWIYFFQSGQPTNSEISGSSLPVGESVPPTAAAPVTGTAEISQLKILSDESLFDYWIGPDGVAIAITTEGKVVKLSASGQSEKLSDQTTRDLSRVKPSPDGRKAIVSFGYPRRETFSVFNTADRSWQLLPAETLTAAWRPDNLAEIALLLNGSTGPARLVIYNLIDKKTREIMKINLQDASIDWLAKDEIYISERSSADFPSSLWAVSVSRKTIRPIVKEEAGLSVKWLDDGKNALKYSAVPATDEFSGAVKKLSLIDRNGKNGAIFGFITLPEKCAFNATAFYCGVSGDFDSVKLPDDYYKNKNLSPDAIYLAPHGKENTPTVFYGAGNSAIDVWHPIIKENRLIFINRLDNKLYSIGL